MRQQRLRVAKQLEAFEVANCSAAYEQDKAFVLSLVAQWFGTEDGSQDEHAALARFNELVRTRVAQRLRRLLLVGEVQLAAAFTFLAFVLFPIIMAIFAGVRSPATHASNHA